MIKPHGGILIERKMSKDELENWRGKLDSLPQIPVSLEIAYDVINIAYGVYSPLEGFLSKDELTSVVETGRLPNDIPWTIPIILDTDMKLTTACEAVLVYKEKPIALLEISDIYQFPKDIIAKGVYGTMEESHPGVKKTFLMRDYFISGKIKLIEEIPVEFEKYHLVPKETRILFEEKAWRTVVGFQTRNVPHLGHEYVQKTALTFVDGLFINPVIGKKKKGDFRDVVIIKAYESLIENYYLKDRAVLCILLMEMRYAGPREAIHHAIVRKNFGCTHFIVGRDHAGVGNFYEPYAAQEIFDNYPDIGITPIFFKSFYYCKKCMGVVNEKTCPHSGDDLLTFSGTKLRNLLIEGVTPPPELMREEVVSIIREFENPFVG